MCSPCSWSICYTVLCVHGGWCTSSVTSSFSWTASLQSKCFSLPLPHNALKHKLISLRQFKAKSYLLHVWTNSTAKIIKLWKAAIKERHVSWSVLLVELLPILFCAFCIMFNLISCSVCVPPPVDVLLLIILLCFAPFALLCLILSSHLFYSSPVFYWWITPCVSMSLSPPSVFVGSSVVLL